ncbi:MAG: hypothetical protein ACXACG_12040 [Candidatus Thorarchaeota archaeon]|jgi:hypothetical protein
MGYKLSFAGLHIMNETRDEQAISYRVLAVFTYLTIIAGLSSNILADWISSGGLLSQIIWFIGAVLATLGIIIFTEWNLENTDH